MVMYKCNFCSKADIPTQAGLKVHIQLSKAGCHEAMEKQRNRSLSLDADVTAGPARHNNICPGPSDFDDVPMDVLFDDILSFVPPPRHADSAEPEPAEYDHQSK
jgi:hypothetical protein